MNCGINLVRVGVCETVQPKENSFPIVTLNAVNYQQIEYTEAQHDPRGPEKA